MKKLLLVLLALWLYEVPSFSGDSATIMVQAPMHPQGAVTVSPGAAQEYWNLYADIKYNPYYGISPERAWEHYQTYGRFEGRTWPGPTPGPDISILSACGSFNTGGSNCSIFPNGGKLGAIAWESSVKSGNSEVLAILFMDSSTQGRQVLITAHHLGITEVIKPITLPDPINVPPGATIWVYADGWSDPNMGGFEVSTTLYFVGLAPAITQ